jgi:putative MFS transporter
MSALPTIDTSDTPDRQHAGPAPDPAYLRRLLIFLSVATFFEGYDMFALAQLLPNIRADFQLSRTEGGWLLGFINVGTVLAFLLIRVADRVGRKKVLSVTIVGYTLASLASAAAPNAVVFGILQCIARVFLIGEWTIAMVFAAEEFPAAKRGSAIGILQACSSLGGIACAGLVPLMLKSPLGWRTVFIAGAVPLAIVAYARRGLKETRRFEEAHARGTAIVQGELGAVLKTVHLKRVLQMAVIWFLSYLCTQNAITFWKDFAVSERGFTDKQVGAAITVAALASMPLVFLAGRLLDVIGRRRGAVIIYGALSLGVFGAYSLHDRASLTVVMVVTVFGASAFLAVLNAYTTELFPTEQRADAFAWSNNLLGRIGYVLSPPLVGYFADQYGYGPTVRATAIFPLLALGLILALLPETRGRELEETAGL